MSCKATTWDAGCKHWNKFWHSHQWNYSTAYGWLTSLLWIFVQSPTSHFKVQAIDLQRDKCGTGCFIMAVQTNVIQWVPNFLCIMGIFRRRDLLNNLTIKNCYKVEKFKKFKNYSDLCKVGWNQVAKMEEICWHIFTFYFCL